MMRVCMARGKELRAFQFSKKWLSEFCSEVGTWAQVPTSSYVRLAIIITLVCISRVLFLILKFLILRCRREYNEKIDKKVTLSRYSFTVIIDLLMKYACA